MSEAVEGYVVPEHIVADDVPSELKPPMFAEEILKDRRRISDLLEECDRLERARLAALDDAKKLKAERDSLREERDAAVKSGTEARTQIPPLRGQIIGLEGLLNQYRQAVGPLVEAVRAAASLAGDVPKEEG